MGGLVATYATAAANIFALQQAFSALSRAAQFEQTLKGFETLAAVSGRSADEITKNIKRITQGQLTLSETAQLANLTLSSGLGSSLEDLVTIGTKASRALGRNLTDSIQRIIRASVKMEKELLDEIGIFVRLDTAARKYAESLGVSVSQLSEFQKQTAFTLAVIEEGKQKFSDIDITTENSAVSLERFGASILDAGANFGIAVANIVTFLNILEPLGNQIIGISAALLFLILRAKAAFGPAILSGFEKFFNTLNSWLGGVDTAGVKAYRTLKELTSNAEKARTSLNDFRGGDKIFSKLFGKDDRRNFDKELRTSLDKSNFNPLNVTEAKNMLKDIELAQKRLTDKLTENRAAQKLLETQNKTSTKAYQQLKVSAANLEKGVTSLNLAHTAFTETIEKNNIVLDTANNKLNKISETAARARSKLKGFGAGSHFSGLFKGRDFDREIRAKLDPNTFDPTSTRGVKKTIADINLAKERLHKQLAKNRQAFRDNKKTLDQYRKSARNTIRGITALRIAHSAYTDVLKSSNAAQRATATGFDFMYNGIKKIGRGFSDLSSKMLNFIGFLAPFQIISSMLGFDIIGLAVKGIKSLGPTSSDVKEEISGLATSIESLTNKLGVSAEASKFAKEEVDKFLSYIDRVGRGGITKTDLKKLTPFKIIDGKLTIVEKHITVMGELLARIRELKQEADEGIDIEKNRHAVKSLENLYSLLSKTTPEIFSLISQASKSTKIPLNYFTKIIEGTSGISIALLEGKQAVVIYGDSVLALSDKTGKTDLALQGLRIRLLGASAVLAKLRSDYNRGAITQESFDKGIRSVRTAMAGVQKDYDNFVLNNPERISEVSDVGAAIASFTALQKEMEKIKKEFDEMVDKGKRFKKLFEKDIKLVDEAELRGLVNTSGEFARNQSQANTNMIDYIRRQISQHSKLSKQRKDETKNINEQINRIRARNQDSTITRVQIAGLQDKINAKNATFQRSEENIKDIIKARFGAQFKAFQLGAALIKQMQRRNRLEQLAVANAKTNNEILNRRLDIETRNAKFSSVEHNNKFLRERVNIENQIAKTISKHSMTLLENQRKVNNLAKERRKLEEKISSIIHKWVVARTRDNHDSEIETLRDLLEYQQSNSSLTQKSDIAFTQIEIADKIYQRDMEVLRLEKLNAEIEHENKINELEKSKENINLEFSILQAKNAQQIAAIEIERQILINKVNNDKEKARNELANLQSQRDILSLQEDIRRRQITQQKEERDFQLGLLREKRLLIYKEHQLGTEILAIEGDLRLKDDSKERKLFQNRVNQLKGLLDKLSLTKDNGFFASAYRQSRSTESRETENLKDEMRRRVSILNVAIDRITSDLHGIETPFETLPGRIDSLAQAHLRLFDIRVKNIKEIEKKQSEHNKNQLGLVDLRIIAQNAEFYNTQEEYDRQGRKIKRTFDKTTRDVVKSIGNMFNELTKSGTIDFFGNFAKNQDQQIRNSLIYSSAEAVKLDEYISSNQDKVNSLRTDLDSNPNMHPSERAKIEKDITKLLLRQSNFIEIAKNNMNQHILAASSLLQKTESNNKELERGEKSRERELSLIDEQNKLLSMQLELKKQSIEFDYDIKRRQATLSILTINQEINKSQKEHAINVLSYQQKSLELAREAHNIQEQSNKIDFDRRLESIVDKYKPIIDFLTESIETNQRSSFVQKDSLVAQSKITLANEEYKRDKELLNEKIKEENRQHEQKKKELTRAKKLLDIENDIANKRFNLQIMVIENEKNNRNIQNNIDIRKLEQEQSNLIAQKAILQQQKKIRDDQLKAQNDDRLSQLTILELRQKQIKLQYDLNIKILRQLSKAAGIKLNINTSEFSEMSKQFTEAIARARTQSNAILTEQLKGSKSRFESDESARFERVRALGVEIAEKVSQNLVQNNQSDARINQVKELNTLEGKLYKKKVNNHNALVSLENKKHKRAIELLEREGIVLSKEHKKVLKNIVNTVNDVMNQLLDSGRVSVNGDIAINESQRVANMINRQREEADTYSNAIRSWTEEGERLRNMRSSIPPFDQDAAENLDNQIQVADANMLANQKLLEDIKAKQLEVLVEMAVESDKLRISTEKLLEDRQKELDILLLQNQILEINKEIAARDAILSTRIQGIDHALEIEELLWEIDDIRKHTNKILKDISSSDLNYQKEKLKLEHEINELVIKRKQIIADTSTDKLSANLSAVLNEQQAFTGLYSQEKIDETRKAIILLDYEKQNEIINRKEDQARREYNFQMALLNIEEKMLENKRKDNKEQRDRELDLIDRDLRRKGAEFDKEYARLTTEEANIASRLEILDLEKNIRDIEIASDAKSREYDLQILEIEAKLIKDRFDNALYILNKEGKIGDREFEIKSDQAQKALNKLIGNQEEGVAGLFDRVRSINNEITSARERESRLILDNARNVAYEEQKRNKDAIDHIIDKYLLELDRADALRNQIKAKYGLESKAAKNALKLLELRRKKALENFLVAQAQADRERQANKDATDERLRDLYRFKNSFKNIINDLSNSLTRNLKDSVHKLNEAILTGNLNAKNFRKGLQGMFHNVALDLMNSVTDELFIKPAENLIKDVFGFAAPKTTEEVLNDAYDSSAQALKMVQVRGPSSEVDPVNGALQPAREDWSAFTGSILLGLAAIAQGANAWEAAIVPVIIGVFTLIRNEMIATQAAATAFSGLMGVGAVGGGSANIDYGGTFWSSGGNVIKKMASGGQLRDRVPALLEPGEFVIRKSSVDKLGLSVLEKLNANGKIVDNLMEEGIVRMNTGGLVKENYKASMMKPSQTNQDNSSKNVIVNINNKETAQETDGTPTITQTPDAMIINVVTKNLRNNGAIRRSLRGAA